MIGALLLLQLLAVRVLFRATLNGAYLLGHRLPEMCEFKRRTGLPCPTCGTTRGFILSVSGNLLPAWQLNPLGPLLASGMVFAAVLFMAIGLAQPHFSKQTLGRVTAIVRSALLAYVVLVCVVWLVAWAHSFLIMSNAR